MKRWVKRALVCIVIAGVLLPPLFCVNMYTCPHFLVFPSTRRLSERYLRDVVAGRQQVSADMAALKGAEVRNVRIGVECGQGSDDELEFGVVEFEYRSPGDAEWQRGTIRVWTDFRVGERREVVDAMWSRRDD